MAQYENLKATIAAAIKANGEQAITGAVLQEKMLAQVDVLGAGYQFGGLITPEDTFTLPEDANFVFLACTAGTYTNHGGLTLDSGQMALFLWNGKWKKQVISYFQNTQVYGVRHFFNNSSPTLTRIGGADLHRELPVQSLMRRCVVDDLGNVKYYLHSTDSTKKVDGTTAILDGTDGQVMVEIPAHYRKCTLDSTNGYFDVEVSLYPFDGAIPRPRRLVGAYEATIDRDNYILCSVKNPTAQFRGGDNNDSWDDTYRSLLGLPATALSLQGARAYGQARGTGWGAYDYNAHVDIYWLFVIEYATLNAQLDFNASLTTEGYHQGGIGGGVSNMDTTKWQTYNGHRPIIPCGTTNALGNASGTVTWEMTSEQAAAYGSSFSTNVPSYRGIENWFGHLYKVTDGILFLTGGSSYYSAYVCRNSKKYADTITEDYTLISSTLPRTSGWKKAITATDTAISQEIRVYGDIVQRLSSGSSTTYFSDYGYPAPDSSGDITCLWISGCAIFGGSCGPTFTDCSSRPTIASVWGGHRLCWSE